METIKPLIGISWSNLIISILIIVGFFYLGFKLLKRILDK